MSGDRAQSACAVLAGLRRRGDDLYALILDPKLHPQGLNRLAALALGRGEPHAAYAFADRRCRIKPVPGARDYLLRAEASRRLGDDVGASADTRFARDLDPLDPMVNLQALRCLDGADREEAAATIVADTTAYPAHIAQSVAHLDPAGKRVIARIGAEHDRLSGWVTWPRGETLHCALVETAPEATFVVVPEPHHPLANPARSAATVAFSRSPSARSRIRFHTSASAEPAWSATFEPIEPDDLVPILSAVRALAFGDGVDLLVIVPVYEDLDATTACLDSLRDQTLSNATFAVVVVEDASPNPQITAELETRARRGDFTLIRNPRNLGFAASVNAAAATRTDGEILILNADTLLPPRALERLLAVLHADPEIGTVTPLSNNGELTSFPVPHAFNPLPPHDKLLAWDAAAEAQAAAPIDLPNGIGFCLLVRRTCWERLGGIATIYGRGYYEDVDLCLRARDLGFRNVCATNLIVGHAGSRSFKAKKRALVMRNLEIVRTRFPTLEAESAAFLRAEPLRPVFAAIERRIPPPPHDVVLVTALSDAHPTPQARFRALRAGGERVLLLSVVDAGSTAALRSVPGDVPQSLRFTIAEPDERRALLGYLSAAEIRRVEFVDIEGCPSDLLDALLELGRPINVLVAGLSSLVASSRDGQARAAGSPDLTRRPSETDAQLPRWASRLRPGDFVIGSDNQAVAAARQVLAGRPTALAVDPVPRRALAHTYPRAPMRDAPTPALAILAPVATGEVSRLITAIRDRLARSYPGAELLVIGTIVDDRSLIASGGAFVTGPVPVDDFPRLIETYGYPALVSPYRDGLFHLIEALGPDYPAGLGYFDWAGSGYRLRRNDLTLDPKSSDAEAATRIVAWLPAPQANSQAGRTLYV